MMTMKELELAWNSIVRAKEWRWLDLEELVAFAQEVEREECAKICDEYDDGRYANAADLCAFSIRDRSKKVTGDKS